MNSKSDISKKPKLTRYYYATCASTVHKGWSSKLYKTQRPAENAARMHNQVNFPGHNAKVVTIDK